MFVSLSVCQNFLSRVPQSKKPGTSRRDLSARSSHSQIGSHRPAKLLVVAKMGTVPRCSVAGLIFEAAANIFSWSANHFRTQCHRFVCSREAAWQKSRRVGKSEEKCNCCRGQQAAGCPSVDEAKNMLISLLLFLHSLD